VSLGQTGDTLTCYTPGELKKIADRLVRSHECDTLLTISNQQLSLKALAITSLKKSKAAQDSIILSKQRVIVLKEDIISGQDVEITDLRDAINKQNNKTKWLKIGWISTSVAFVAILLFGGSR